MSQIDEISQLVTADTDTKISSLEERLNLQGFTLGYFHPPKNEFLVEEVLSRKLPNLYSLLYGELKDLVVAIGLQKNELNLQTKVAPRQATGPSWKNFLLGSGKSLGVFYQAVFKIFPLPTEIIYSVIGFSSLEGCYRFERELRRNELIPACFQRFSKSKLKRRFLSLKDSILLILEWRGFYPLIDSMLTQFDVCIGKKYSHERIEDFKEKKHLSKILRESLPEIGWGGVRVGSSDRESLKLKKELVDFLK